MKFLKIFQIFGILMLAYYSSSFSLTRWGLPDYTYLASYGINDYLTLPDRSRSILHIDRFNSQVLGKINSKYSSVGTSLYIRRTNSDATRENFLNDNTNFCEMVLFHGHGSNNTLCFYSSDVTAGEKSFGGDTRWAFFECCLTLNGNVAPWFNGIHSICGYRSIQWDFEKSYACWDWDFTCWEHSEEIWEEFATRFIDNGETIWEAWYNAVRHQIYDDGGYSVEPATAFVMGNADNGQSFTGYQERYANTYNNPFNSANGATNIGYGYAYGVLGTPQY